MSKIAFVGAGSSSFAKRLVSDLLHYPEFADVTISLHDIDPERLALSSKIAHRVARASNTQPQIEATTDRQHALDGADYVVSMFQVGGYRPATLTDFEVAKRYGLRQTIGDTLGIGGIMRALRTIPVLLDVCRDMEMLCPDALHINYVNPMAMNCWALTQASPIRTVGLCHSVPSTAEYLARLAEVPFEEINYLVAGINHLAFFLRIEWNGQDLYPRLRQVISRGEVPDDDRVRFEMMKRLGYFVTESSEHFSEYVPYFIKKTRSDLIARYNIPLDEYLHRCQLQDNVWHLIEERIDNPDAHVEDAVRLELDRAQVTPAMEDFVWDIFSTIDRVIHSHEYGPQIIHSIETDTPRVVYANLSNRGLIDNLPRHCIVEVPCLVDRNGVQPTRIGELPPHLAALMRTNVNVQALTVEAALMQKREHIYHAAMLDPHTGAELDLEEIWALVDDLIEAHKDWLPAYD